ncbi:hypothetical protein NUW58_g4233 [Xylaria curta]|uniref:Uncharacterized protein n=1 Tax=Xylaria curta TaxID=42375 RepID=A0ACC1P7E2_9PEZI|nr:hypothetical protein NUW58_g4233 [Xylaria curta]
MRSMFLAALLLLAAGVLSSQPRMANGLLGNAYESRITWTGCIDEDDDLMSFTGPDLRHIEMQIREIKPDFSWPLGTELTARDSLAKDKGDILCNMASNTPFASVFHIRQYALGAVLFPGLATLLRPLALT